MTSPRRSSFLRPSILLYALAVCISISFQVLVAVVPAVAERIGPHGMAGVATASLSIGAVLGEIAAPALMVRFTSRRLLVAGQITTMIATLPLLLPAIPVPATLVSTAVRGLGIGSALVVAVTLLVQSTPTNRQGAAFGRFGLALGLPSVVVPSLGVYLLAYGHTEVVALIAAISSAAGALSSSALPQSRTLPVSSRIWAELRGQPGLLLVFVGFLLASTSFGAVVTYAPIALPLSGVGSAATLLLIAGIARTLSRWLTGPISDRAPLPRVLVSATIIISAGIMLLATRFNNVAIIVAGVAFGTGYGALQTAGFIALSRIGRNGALVSALWNSGIDLGSAMGGALLGLSAAYIGYGGAIWIMPAVVLLSGALFSVRVTGGPKTDPLQTYRGESV